MRLGNGAGFAIAGWPNSNSGGDNLGGFIRDDDGNGDGSEYDGIGDDAIEDPDPDNAGDWLLLVVLALRGKSCSSEKS